LVRGLKRVRRFRSGGRARVSLISPAGLHFGEGAMHVLAADPMGKPTFNTATVLMQALIARDLCRSILAVVALCLRSILFKVSTKRQ
jgi:hypothetical protein